MAAKGCIHNDYAPAKNVCASPLENSASEFPTIHVEYALICLSSRVSFRDVYSLDDDAQQSGQVRAISVEAYEGFE